MAEIIHEIIVEIKDSDFHENGLDGCREVVRCKDCKFHYDRTQCKKRIGAWFDDDYCNGAVRAERKDNETD